MGSVDGEDTNGGIPLRCRSIVKVVGVEVAPVLRRAFSLAFRTRTGRDALVEESDDPQ